MSYDLSLTLDEGGPEPAYLAGFDWNYTSNVAPMWREAMPGTDGLAGMDGMAAREAATTLGVGIEAMKANPAKYHAMNPDNGWGTFDGEHGQLRRLEYLLEWCERAPNAILTASR